MKILILGAAPHADDADAPPVWLAEHSGEILVERFVNACSELKGQMVFAVRAEDVQRYRLDNVIAIAAPGSALVSVRGTTRGAACTALLCSHHIDADDELLILSGNEFLDVSYAGLVNDFRRRELDAGVPTFRALHPRYSYVRLDESDFVTEAAEKNPISNHAMAGFVWFRRGEDFVTAAQNMVRKDAHVNGSFFVSLTLNELVLRQKRIGTTAMDPRQYRPLKSRRQVLAYEGALEGGVAMKHARLEDMVKGWFVGDFDPSVSRSKDVEVGVKHYRAGDHEEEHHHRVAVEITLVVSGQVEMMGRTWAAGDIIVVEPGEATSFTALTDATNVVVKLPSVTGDKYFGRLPG